MLYRIVLTICVSLNCGKVLASEEPTKNSSEYSSLESDDDTTNNFSTKIQLLLEVIEMQEAGIFLSLLVDQQLHPLLLVDDEHELTVFDLLVLMGCDVRVQELLDDAILYSEDIDPEAIQEIYEMLCKVEQACKEYNIEMLTQIGLENFLFVFEKSDEEFLASLQKMKSILLIFLSHGQVFDDEDMEVENNIHNPIIFEVLSQIAPSRLLLHVL